MVIIIKILPFPLLEITIPSYAFENYFDLDKMTRAFMQHLTSERLQINSQTLRSLGTIGVSMSKKHRVSTHVLPTSATMIGVCMTVINLVQLTEAQRGNTRADELLAIDSVLFMVSAFCSYISMRCTEDDKLGIRYEKFADIAFISGLFLMTIAGVLITYQLV